MRAEQSEHAPQRGMRILVIGGRGFYGRHVVAALEKLEGVEVVTGGRSGPVVVDLRVPETFSVFNDFDVLIGCHDSVAVPSDAAASWCIEHGRTWLDLGADLASAERLLALETRGPGRAVVGVGLFPGLSTALAAEAAAAVGRPQRVEVGIQLGVLSGAGRGACALMVAMLAQPSVWMLGGKRLEGPTLGADKVFDFMGSPARIAQRVGLPDVSLVHEATGAPEVSTRLAIKPVLLRPAFSMAVWAVRLAGAQKRFVLALVRWNLLFLRAFLLRRVRAVVQITAQADPGGQTRRLTCPDGHRATGIGVAAAVACLLAGQRTSATGVLGVGSAFPPDALLAHALRLDPEIRMDSGG